MPLVYVHGIANRSGPKMDHAGAVRDRLFRECLLPACAGPQPIHAPFWGDLAGRLRWDGASIPRGTRQALGADDEYARVVEGIAADGPVDADEVVLGVARRSLADGIDLLYTAALAADTSLDDPTAEELGTLAARLVTTAGEQGDRPGWLGDVTDDVELLDRLEKLTAAPAGTDGRQALGVAGDAWAVLRRGASRLRRTAVALSGRPVIGGARLVERRTLPLLVGDVLAYLAQRGAREAPGGIVAEILAALDTAAHEPGPLIVVAHSMGGNIVYDILTHYRPGLAVDALVTVGSQVGLFEELKLFHASADDIPGAGGTRVAAPAGVRRWINVVDRNDPLAFRAEPIFEGAEDYDYPSGAVWAHGAYLRQPHFHARLGRRIGWLDR